MREFKDKEKRVKANHVISFKNKIKKRRNIVLQINKRKD